MLTYERQKELVAQGLATVSINENLATFKYAKKVMFDYLWDKHPDLLECRGHTYDNRTGQLVVAAPRKSFNYLENGTWKDVPLDTPVTAYKKFNGFMACESVFEGKKLISTTGSTKSDFVGMATEMIDESFGNAFTRNTAEGLTYLYEIIHKDDPHIVNDGEPRAVFLGMRDHEGGEFTSAYSTCEFTGTLRELLESTQEHRSEGFMVYSEFGVCKLKTPYYVGKKKLMRAGKKQILGMYDDPVGYISGFGVSPKWSHEWIRVCNEILSDYTYDFWLAMDAQERRRIIEGFME